MLHIIVLTWLSINLLCSTVHTWARDMDDRVNMDAPANHPVDTLRSTNMGDTSLEKRYDFTNSPYICNGDELGYATSKDIERGVKYLHGVKGKPVNEAGKCGRVSCEWQSAIWWCNWNDFTLTLDSFGDIADGVRYLETKCNVYNDETGVNIAGEVRNEDDNWTVIVRKNNC